MCVFQGLVRNMGQRQGTILKKRKCADQDKRPHKEDAAVLGSRAATGAQFRRRHRRHGAGAVRVRGAKLAQDAQLKVAHDKEGADLRAPKLGSAQFEDECTQFISRMGNTEGTRAQYLSVLHATSARSWAGVPWPAWRRPAMT